MAIITVKDLYKIFGEPKAVAEALDLAREGGERDEIKEQTGCVVAVQNNRPIVVTGWKPHWMFARWQLKFLDDPREVYGQVENIHTIGRPGIEQDLPELVNFFREFSFNDSQIGTLMEAMNNSSSQDRAARAWIEEHRGLVDSWLGKTGRTTED